MCNSLFLCLKSTCFLLFIEEFSKRNILRFPVEGDTKEVSAQSFDVKTLMFLMNDEYERELMHAMET